MSKKLSFDISKMPIFTSRRVTVALSGLNIFFTTQNSALIILFFTLSLVALAVIFGLMKQDWLWLILGLALVWLAEIMNTSIEFVCNTITIEFHPYIKIAKDVGAGGVFFASLILFVIVLFIFPSYF